MSKKPPIAVPDDQLLETIEEVVLAHSEVEVEFKKLAIVLVNTASKASVIPEKFRVINPKFDFLIELSRSDLVEFGLDGCKALIHHLLMFCGYDEKEQPIRREPDYAVSGFSSTLNAYGDWSNETRKILRVTKQLSLLEDLDQPDVSLAPKTKSTK